MSVNSNGVLALYILAILSLISVVYGWINHPEEKLVTYPLWSVYGLNTLNDSFKQYHKQIHRIAEEYTKTKSRNLVKCIPSQYTDDIEYMKNAPDAWMPNWNSSFTHPNWYTYPIVYNGKLFPYIEDKLLIEIITPHLPFINELGFSLIESHNSIHTHTDSTSAKKGSLSYHYNLYGDGSIIVLDGKYEYQEPGNALLFNASYPHSVKNGPNNRVIIYADVKYKKPEYISFPF